jgi:hypothetical protein
LYISKFAVVSFLRASISVHSYLFCDKSEFELFRLMQILWQLKRNYRSLIIFWLWPKTFDVNRGMKEEAISNTAKYGGCNRHRIVSGSFRLISVPPEVRHHLIPSLPFRWGTATYFWCYPMYIHTILCIYVL